MEKKITFDTTETQKKVCIYWSIHIVVVSLYGDGRCSGSMRSIGENSPCSPDVLAAGDVVAEAAGAVMLAVAAGLAGIHLAAAAVADTVVAWSCNAMFEQAIGTLFQHHPSCHL